PGITTWVGLTVFSFGMVSIVVSPLFFIFSIRRIPYSIISGFEHVGTMGILSFDGVDAHVTEDEVLASFRTKREWYKCMIKRYNQAIEGEGFKQDIRMASRYTSIGHYLISLGLFLCASGLTLSYWN
ncbi:MAG: hypothetical protein ABEI99_07850, partial [Halobaculum sp.]